MITKCRIQVFNDDASVSTRFDATREIKAGDDTATFTTEAKEGQPTYLYKIIPVNTQPGTRNKTMYLQAFGITTLHFKEFADPNVLGHVYIRIINPPPSP